MLPQKECCGCEACLAACKFGAITLKPDDGGFMYPSIDTSKCVNCHACEQKCTVLNPPKSEYAELMFVGGYYKDNLKSFSSGGAASAIAKLIIDRGGVVYGVAWTDDFKGAEYVRIVNLEDLIKIRGTKYIQSSKHNGKIYREVEKDLNDNSTVLFIGLPCEVAALKRYVGKNCANLYTVQLICHGVTSGMFLKEYINYIEKKCNSKATYLNLRFKKHGVDPKYIQIQMNNNRVFERKLLITEFGYTFVNCDRESCYECKFKGDNRVADITIGDYWGILETDDHYQKDGNSIIIVHSEKGLELERLLNDQSEFVVFNADPDKARKGNPKMYKSSVKSNKRDQIIENIKKYGFIKGCRKTYTVRDRSKILFYKCIPLFIQHRLLTWIK